MVDREGGQLARVVGVPGAVLMGLGSIVGTGHLDERLMQSPEGPWSRSEPKRELRGTGAEVPRRSTFLAGARFRVRTPGSDSGFVSEHGSKPGFDDADRELLDWLIEKALEEFFPPFPLAMSMIDRVREHDRSRRRRR